MAEDGRTHEQACPETAESLSIALIQLEADRPQTLAHPPQIKFSASVVSRESAYRHRTVEALRDYCRSFTNIEQASPSPQTAARQKLDELGLRTNLWSLHRAMTRATAGYERLSRADYSLAQQRSSDQELQFLQLLLSACLDEVSLTLDAFLPSTLRTRVFKAFLGNERILEANIDKAVAPALLCLIVQGYLPQSEFEIFIGLNSERAKIEIAKLEQLGILAASKAKPGHLEPGLPGWFTVCLLPHL
ncbi:hypothetical protein BW687_002100 [Pseudomonas graminis]|uniref:hypothetical protein n=1 Tax=Pseudomonas graminis TaxID=158627 RepID=UPI00234903E9|nr:hypothetical protein [Pseudomonas graminis]MDC6378966.1 hypothetical protein [Pseudomonas graminis]